MATKTSKRAGETSTTVSVGIRIDPKIKFALDIIGRLQKRSLTAVIEWSISQAIEQQPVDQVGTSLSTMLDKIWSTDESMRLVMLALNLPQALTYDEFRVWETIKISSCFWRKSPDGSVDSSADGLDFDAVRASWNDLMRHVDLYKSSITITPLDL